MFFELTINDRSENFFANPPLFPKNEIEKIFFFLDSFNTSIIFLEFPEVDIDISTSSLFPNAFKFLAKIFLKE